MDYNTQRKKLPLPEYGRNIQNMVDYLFTIEDRDKRNKSAQVVIDVMGNLYPYLRDVAEFKHKLWDHLAIMSDFKLDIDYPYNPPTPDILTGKPKRVPYPVNNIKYRHYGFTIFSFGWQFVQSEYHVLHLPFRRFCQSSVPNEKIVPRLE